LVAFSDQVNEKVSGIVKMKIYKGNVMVTAINSKYSLLNSNMASFDDGASFNQNVSAGFIELYGLQQKMAWKIGKGWIYGKRPLEVFGKGLWEALD
ncbi:MAG: argininosuccinate synthase, partial [Candidatus Gracilibacteria bacterium]|nr:argininosuccinate synthase [Candidatus Gracilibacteria bacterium]